MTTYNSDLLPAKMMTRQSGEVLMRWHRADWADSVIAFDVLILSDCVLTDVGVRQQGMGRSAGRRAGYREALLNF